VIAAAVAGIGFPLFADPPASWDMTAQFSTENGNPNGPWSYGWYDTSFTTFTLFNPGVWCSTCPGWYVAPTGDWTPNIVFNSCGCFNQYVVPMGWITFHPGPGQQPVAARFTVPPGVGSKVRAVGEFLAGDSGWMQVAVRHNGAEVFRAGDAGAFDLLLTISAGDVIEFAVFGGYSYGNTPVRAVISVPSCGADLGSAGGVSGADGLLNNNDFIAFINAFFAVDAAADLGEAGGLAGHDGQFDNNDFIAFINLFFAGC
jgi:hypothetical protein